MGWAPCVSKRLVAGSSWSSGCQRHGEYGRRGIGAVFMATERVKGKKTPPLDSLMSETEVVRSLWWWICCRGKNRLERVGMGIGCRRTTTKASEGLA